MYKHLGQIIPAEEIGLERNTNIFVHIKQYNYFFFYLANLSLSEVYILQ